MTAGSDCLTGKRQYATRQAAAETVAAQRARIPGTRPAPFRCAWCGCFHVGNRRADSSKHRARR
jgi:hypothetical protein